MLSKTKAVKKAGMTSQEKVETLAERLNLTEPELKSAMAELDISFEGRWGLLTYDVPKRSMYARIHKRLRPFLMLNWSSYMFRWEDHTQLRAAMEALRFDKDGEEIPESDRIRWELTNQGPNEDDTLHRRAGERIETVIKETKNKLIIKLSEATQMQTQFEEVAGRALDKARKKLEQAKQWAMTFALSDVLEVGLEAFEAFIEHKSKLYDDEIVKRATAAGQV